MQQMNNAGNSAVDEVIDRLDEYIDNPKLVTKETLTELRDMLMGESESEGEMKMDDSEESENESPGLIIAIGRKAGHAKMKGGMHE